MNKVLILILAICFASLNAFASVDTCSKNPVIKSELEKKSLLSCKFINQEYLETIRELDMNCDGEGQIGELTKNDFAGMTNLREVRIKKCGITRLGPELFSESQRVYLAAFESNEINDIDPRAFHQAPFLTKVFLNQNQLTDLAQGTFAELPKLEFIAITGNSIREIQSHVFTGPRIQTIALSGNEIETISPDALVLVENLISFYISGNNLKTLPADLFKRNNRLGYISLSGNPFESLPHGLFSEAAHYSKIAITETPLSEFPPGFFSGIKVTELLLRKNRIQNLEGMFEGADIIELDLSRNEITSLNDGDLFFESQEVKMINLEKNKIVSISEKTFNRELRTGQINLRNNLITEVPEGVFKDWRQNPWKVNFGGNALATHTVLMLKDQLGESFIY